MKKIICAVLAVLMLAALSCTAFAESGQSGVEPGKPMPDFSVSLTDGTTATLSELLKEKDLVVLNIFATWCGPCKNEFPDMEKTYQAHSDRMLILSLSGDPDDTMEMIADYQSDNGLTFPMGQAGDLMNVLRVTGFPTTYFIDRDGNIGFIKTGAFLEEGEFEEKVNLFLSNDYDGNPLPSETAHSSFLPLLGVILGSGLLLTIGRWLLLRKAGKPGWHSLIPFLNSYQEYSLGWKGWLGILENLCLFGSTAFFLIQSHPNWALISSFVLAIAYVVLRLLESVKLAKAFGKGAGLGVLLTVFLSIGRFFLGVSKAKYRSETD